MGCDFKQTVSYQLLYYLPSRYWRKFVSREYEKPRSEGVVEESPPAVGNNDLSVEFNLHANP